jgi:anaphase-promoting complex subunit 6
MEEGKGEAEKEESQRECLKMEDFLNYLKETVKTHKNKNCYVSAIFYADKVVSLHRNYESESYIDATYELADCYFLNNEYLRAVQLIEKTGLGYYNEKFRTLFAQAYFSAGNIDECINVLKSEETNGFQLEHEIDRFSNYHQYTYYEGLKALILGKAYESQENKDFAVKYFTQSLSYNCENIEAFDRLICNFLLSHDEKKHLLDKIGFSEKNLWLKDYYRSRIEETMLASELREGLVNVEEEESGVKKRGEDENKLKSILDILQENNNNDILFIEAENLYKKQNCGRSLELIKRMLEGDFYYLKIMPLYCACLIELEKTGDLYYLAHKLVTSNPHIAVSWFAVGSYYFLIKKYDIGRKYFQKANQLDKHFCASWMAFGHCYAAQNESDQAMAAYRTAARLFPGCYLANVCIGMEYLRTNNLKTANISFDEALKIYDQDPCIYNEKGVVLYKSRVHDQAKTMFKRALTCCYDMNSPTYETICKNLGNCYRKLKNYNKAIEYYEKCLRINPKSASSYTALGFAYHLTGGFKDALDCYHKASYLKSDDSLTTELIAKAIQDINSVSVDVAYFN